LLIAAVGNDGTATLNYPAAYPEVVSVVAVRARVVLERQRRRRGRRAGRGDPLDRARRRLCVIHGTSMATPHAAGVAAEIWRTHASWTAAQVRSRLDLAVDDLGAAGRDPSFGFGLNLQQAVLP
jgi:subtilisin family serine protease